MGNLKGRPPAKGLPLGAVWQAAQSAARVRYSPRATKSALARSEGAPVGSGPLNSASSTCLPLTKSEGSPARSVHHPAATTARTTTAKIAALWGRLI